MPKKSKNKGPIKVRWEYVPASDAEARLEAAFDLIFAAREEKLSQAAEAEGEATATQDPC